MTAARTTNARNGANWVIPAGVAVAVVMGLLQVFWTVAYGGLVANQNRIEEQMLKRLLIIEAQFLRIREHEEFTKRIDNTNLTNMARIDTLAPRNEIDSRLLANSAALQQLRTEIVEFKRDFGQTYSVKDALAQIQTRMERLESWNKTSRP